MTDALTSLVLIVAALTIIYRNVFSNPSEPRQTLVVPSEPLMIAGAAMRGTLDARTVMVVYSDFQCPFCGRFAREILPEIERRYVSTGRLALVFRHLPLPIHTLAVQAAVTAECAGRQGRFWETHDQLFAEAKLDEQVLLSISKSLGLDEPLFDECVTDRAVAESVSESVAQANTLGIRSTPTFYFGKRLTDGRIAVTRALSGLRPTEELIREIESALEEERPSWRSWFRPFA